MQRTITATLHPYHHAFHSLKLLRLPACGLVAKKIFDHRIVDVLLEELRDVTLGELIEPDARLVKSLLSRHRTPPFLTASFQALSVPGLDCVWSTLQCHMAPLWVTKLPRR